MTVRIATAIDMSSPDVAIVADLLDGQRPLMESIFGRDPEWTPELVLKIIQRERIYLYGDTLALTWVSPDRSREYGVRMCMSQAGTPQQRINRFKAAVRELGTRWFNDCIAAGVPECAMTWRDSERSFARVQGWDKIAQFWTFKIDEEHDRITWAGTPEQGLAGVATV